MKNIKNILFIITIGWAIATVLFIIEQVYNVLSGIPLIFNGSMLIDYGYYVLYAVPLSFVNAYFFDYIHHRIDWKEKQKYRLIVGLVGSVFITLLTLFFVRILHRVIIQKNSFETFFNTENISFYFTSLIITLVISLFFHAFYFYKLLQEKKVTEQKIIAGTASAQFESLKNQIDPHFLFNSLNVLTSLIEEQPDTAQKFTTSLSKVYRYVLEQKDKELVSVEEELNFAKTYMDLLKIRFENSITYQLPEKINNPEAKVVPLSLQLLLENTIKHNVVSETKPLHIRIYEEDNYLVVENNLQKKEVLQTRKGVGLQNIVNRFNLLTERKIFIEENKEIFKVKIPELTKQITVMETSNTLTETNNSYYRAQKKVKEMKDFYGNLLSYCIVIPFLVFINYYTYWGFKWFLFPLFGWGLGVAIHGFTVFGYGTDWEERKIRQIMDKEQQNNSKTWN